MLSTVLSPMRLKLKSHSFSFVLGFENEVVLINKQESTLPEAVADFGIEQPAARGNTN